MQSLFATPALTASGAYIEGGKIDADFGGAAVETFLEVGKGNVGFASAGCDFLRGALAGPFHHAEDERRRQVTQIDLMRHQIDIGELLRAAAFKPGAEQLVERGLLLVGERNTGQMPVPPQAANSPGEAAQP